MESFSASILHLVGRFTSHDEQLERMSVTPAERAAIDSDLRGGPNVAAALERMSLIDEELALAELDDEVARLPDEEGVNISKKAAYLEAERSVCPRLVDEEHKMAFLYAERFDAKKAAERLINYWHQRRILFGPDKWLLPMTLRGALRDDGGTIARGAHCLLPVKDDFGRAVIYFDPGRRHDPSDPNYSRESVLRSFWYILQVACADRDVQKHGLIMVNNGRNVAMSIVSDPQLLRSGFQLSHCFPVVWRSIHACHPPLWHYLVHPIVSFFSGRHVRLRRLVHFGSEEHVLRELAQYGLSRDRLPTDIGGTLTYDHSKWLAERLAIEDAASFGASEVSPVVSISAALSSFNDLTNSQPEPILCESSTPVIKLDATAANDAPYPCDPVRSNADAVQSRDEQQGGVASSAIGRIRHCSGRQVDARMQRAVEVKLANPRMNLYHVLVAGGFKFPDYGKPGISDKLCFDAEGVSLVQRKNNLCRLVRKTKDKQKKDACTEKKGNISSSSSERANEEGKKGDEFKSLKQLERKDSFEDAINQLPGLPYVAEDKKFQNELLRGEQPEVEQ